MSLSFRLLLLTFLESIASAMVQRGIYFYTHKQFDFSDTLNLTLAIATGATYVAGALASHHLARRMREKPLLVVSLAGQLLCHVALFAWPGPVRLFLFAGALGCFYGLKWPVVESYISAGRTPAATAKAVGGFNITWAASVPLGVAAAGPIIDAWPGGLFVVAAGWNLVNIVLALPLATSPTHLAQDHPERPRPDEVLRYRALLTSSRWSMVLSYGAVWILAALMPGIFKGLGFEPTRATPLASLIDAGRLAAFLLMHRFAGWHSRARPLVLAIFALPAGFFMVLFGGSLAVILVGESLFGLAAGVAYFAALYYAMVVKNAAVQAGSAHESVIGLGFVAGPAAGLVGAALAGPLHSYVLGILAGVGPMFLLAAAGALRPLGKAAAHGPAAPRAGQGN